MLENYPSEEVSKDVLEKGDQVCIHVVSDSFTGKIFKQRALEGHDVYLCRDCLPSVRKKILYHIIEGKITSSDKNPKFSMAVSGQFIYSSTDHLTIDKYFENHYQREE